MKNYLALLTALSFYFCFGKVPSLDLVFTIWNILKYYGSSPAFIVPNPSTLHFYIYNRNSFLGKIIEITKENRLIWILFNFGRIKNIILVILCMIKMVTEGIEPSTVALLAQRSNQLSYATCLMSLFFHITNLTTFLYYLIDYYIKSSTRTIFPRFGLEELLIKGLRDIDFAIECSHFLFILD